jgi:hypothetical protein
MPKFLSLAECYRIIQRELPEDTYPDGAPADYFSTADSDSTARTVATLYSNLERIYANMFPQSADEQIGDWEIKVFGHLGNTSDSLAVRRQKVIDQVRWSATLSRRDLLLICAIAIGAKDIEIANWGCDETGVWVLGESQLGVETYLGGSKKFQFGPSDNLCSTTTPVGLTADQWATMQSDAFTYEVRIYDYTLTTDERAQLDKLLTRYEPGRSTHVIRDGLSSANKPGGTT